MTPIYTIPIYGFSTEGATWVFWTREQRNNGISEERERGVVIESIFSLNVPTQELFKTTCPSELAVYAMTHPEKLEWRQKESEQ